MARTSAKDTDRPTSYTDEIAQVVLDRMAGGEMLSAICEDPTMPDRPTVNGWAINIDIHRFAERLARAREALAHCFADDALKLSMDFDNGKAHDRRLQVETLKWYAAATYPEAFGRLAGTKQPRAGSAPAAAPAGSPAPRVDEGDSGEDCPGHLRGLMGNVAMQGPPEDGQVNGK